MFHKLQVYNNYILYEISNAKWGYITLVYTRSWTITNPEI